MKRSMAFKYALGFAFVGILIISLITYVERKTLSTYEINLPFISMGDYIKYRTTQGHLWLEEGLAGDKSLNYEKDIEPLFTSSLEILESAYEGKATEFANFQKSEDAETNIFLKEAIASLQNLINRTDERWKFHQASAITVDSAMVDNGEAIGGKLDQEFDVAYEHFLETMLGLTTHFDKILETDTASLNSFSWVSIILITVIFILLILFLYRSQYKGDLLANKNKTKLEAETKRVAELNGFIMAVSSGDYTVNLDSIGESDNLGKTLINLRETLKTNAEEEFRRNWATTGIAQFADLLRTEQDDVKELGDVIINKLVKYTKSNQGSLFIVNDENEKEVFIEQLSCYAWNRKKYEQKQIAVGEGIVGQVVQEKEYIYMTDVPDNYVNITSGLGDSNPRSILVIPMKLNDEVFGVIELASFELFEQFQIEFVQKIGENIASTIKMAKVNIRTKKLLAESQSMTEELRSQEEEMRQNMEEMQATHEEMKRIQKEAEEEIKLRRREAEAYMNIVNKSTIVSKTDLRGNITYANDEFCKAAKYKREELIGQNHNVLRHPDMPKEAFEDLWRTISSGKVWRGKVKNKAKDGSHYWVDATITPVLGENGKPVEYMAVRFLITDYMNREEMLN